MNSVTRLIKRAILVGIVVASLASHAATIQLTANQTNITDDRTLSLIATITPAADELGTESKLYFALLAPGGYVFSSDGWNWASGYSGSPMTKWPGVENGKFVFRNVSSAEFLNISMPTTFPEGTYTFYLATAKPGIDTYAEVVSFGRNPFTGIGSVDVRVSAPTQHLTISDPCAVAPKKLGDVTYPVSYNGAFKMPTTSQTLPPGVIRAIGTKDYYPGYLPQDGLCKDRVLHARNLYVETLDRLQQDGVQQTFLYNYGNWDNFGNAVWTVDPSDYQIAPSEVAFFVNEAGKRGIKVVLAWQFTAQDKAGASLPMGSAFSPAQLRQMLASFHNLIVNQARTGEQIGLAGIYADWHAFYISNLASDPVLREIWITEMVSIITDIRKVFSGKILYGANTSVIDPRIAAIIDEYTQSLTIAWPGLSETQNNALTVELVKAEFLKSIQRARAEYDSQMNGSSISVPINWAVAVQSKRDYFINGWTEDGFCVSGCIQNTYVTDYSVQAIGIEAAFQALTSQTYFRNGTIDLDTSYWFTDDVGPDSMGWDDYAKIANWDFPNLSQSIRNKPAETIVRQWFKR